MKHKWYLRVRNYPDRRFASIWLTRRDGAAHSGLLWGEVRPDLVAQISEATGLPVVADDSPLECEPLQPPGCVAVVQQSRFQECP